MMGPSTETKMKRRKHDTGMSSKPLVPVSSECSLSNMDSEEGEEMEEEEQEEGVDRLESVTIEPLIYQVLKGNMSNLPPIPTNIIRIFLSSTFSDFMAERNILPKLAYPELKSYCAEKGLDFQVVDMRWGVTDEAINDHHVSELCIKEIETCQQVSCGPNFVMFLGNRYGYQTFPAKIESTEFEMLIKIAREMKIKNVDVLTEWFLLDENAIPASYVLQPIPSKLKYYADMREEYQRFHKVHQEEWWMTYAVILNAFRETAAAARNNKCLTDKQIEKYFISVTEEEIVQGVFVPKNPSNTALCFRRNLRGIHEDLKNNVAQKFLDVKDGETDSKAQELRKILVEQKIPKSLDASNIKVYDVEWKGGALENSGHQCHEAYLENFSRDFVTNMKILVDRCLESRKKKDDEELHNLYDEVLHHSRFARSKCEIFCGRDDTLQKIQQYITGRNHKENKPLIVYGKSGYGKTTLLAKVASSIPKWLGEKQVTLLRFFGTSPSSSSILHALQSLIIQIAKVYGFRCPSLDTLEKMGETRRVFAHHLEMVSEYSEVPLVIVLDSVDQLQESNGGHNMVWLPKTLPSKVKLVVSMLSDRYTCLENTRKRLNDESCFLELCPLSEMTGDGIINSYLMANHRRITKEQRELIISHFRECRQPLFLKLVMDCAKAWYSYLRVPHIKITKSVEAAIVQLFEELEKNFGRVFVPQALGYLTCGKGGLTGVEMEDVLSVDDSVLQEVYQYHDPPLEGVVRIPSLMWARVGHSLKEYLVERQVDGKIVFTWYHRQFWEAAEERYLSDPVRRKAFHSNLADIFMQENGIRKTIKLKQREKQVEEADRCIAPQLLSVKNIRKLNAQPYHLLEADRIDDLKQNCLLNFNWLLVKLQAVGINATLQEFNQMCEHRRMEGHEEVKLFRNFLELCYPNLHQDPYLLAFHIQHRLEGCTNGNDILDKMVEDAKKWMVTTNVPYLLPTHPMKYQKVDSPLKFSFMAGSDGKVTKDGKLVVCRWAERNSGQSKINAFSLETKDIVASIVTQKVVHRIVTSHDDRHVVYCQNNDVHMCEIDTGDEVKRFSYLDSKYEKVTVRALDLSSDNKMLAVAVRNTEKPKKLKDGESWKKETFIVVVDLEKQKPVCQSIFDNRKPVENLFFVDDNKSILATAKDKITNLTSKDLKIVYECKQFDSLMGTKMVVFPEKQTLISGMNTKKNDSANVLVYNYSNKTYRCSLPVHQGGYFKPNTFGLVAHPENLSVLVGTTSQKSPNEYPHSCLCLWNLEQNKYSFLKLTPKGLKRPHNLIVQPDWQLGFVGWHDGNVTMVNTTNLTEINLFQAHNHAVHFLDVLGGGESLLSMSQDHSLKVWDIACLKKEAMEKRARERLFSIDVVVPYLDDSQQVLHLDTHGGHVITGPLSSQEGPRFWNVEDGNMITELVEKFDRLYQNSLRENDISFQTKTHAAIVHLKKGLLMYERKKRNSLMICLFKDYGHISAHKVFENTFFRLNPWFAEDVPISKLLFLVRDGALEMYDLENLALQKFIKFKPISDDLPNIVSTGTKRRLINYRVAATVDGKYFIILNPSATGSGINNRKYFDLIDMEEGRWVERVPVPYFVSYKILDDGFYILVKHETDGFKVCSAPYLKMLEAEFAPISYQCLLHTGHFVSQDGTLGMELNNKLKTVGLWQINPLRKLHNLTGHLHEVTTGTISPDNLYVATGSYDCTARIWSVETGQQLCLFQAQGSVDRVLFTSCAEYVILHCYGAPQRKRAMVLKLHNLPAAKRPRIEGPALHTFKQTSLI